MEASGNVRATGAHRGDAAPTRWRRQSFMAVFFVSLRGSRGGHQATRWGSEAHHAVARCEGGGDGWCGSARRQRWCSGGRPWLGVGPAALKVGGNGEEGSKLKHCRAVAVLTMKGVGNVVAAAIWPLPTSSGTTAWTRHRLRSLGGNDTQIWWLSCGEESGVGEKCSVAPHVKVEEKLGEEMGQSQRTLVERRRGGPAMTRARARGPGAQ
jgi:hypothetical protein